MPWKSEGGGRRGIIFGSADTNGKHFLYINIWLFPKTPVSAKRVASGGMFRGMFRRYVSEVCFGVCFALPG